MKNAWKWILGIVIVLVVVAGLVGGAVLVRNSMAANMAQRQTAFNNARATALSAQGKITPQSTPGPQSGTQNNPQTSPMRPGFPGFRGFGSQPMMRGGGFGFNRFQGGSRFGGAMPYGPGMMILGGLARLVLFAFFVLLVIGAYLLGRNSRPSSPPAAAPVAASAAHACPKCGNSVLDGSKYCPSCGKKQ